MIPAKNYTPAEIFRLAWAQERLNMLRLGIDINKTGLRPELERSCCGIENATDGTLREALERMQSRITDRLTVRSAQQ